MRRPDFFLVGAPRCGTSAMNTYLNQHPDIFMARKESHFFASDLTDTRFIRSAQEYLSLFDGARNEKRVGEASVLYLYSKHAASEIKRFCPEAKILMILRNPVDLFHSLHSHYLHAGTEDIVDFEAALNAEQDRKRGQRIPKSSPSVESLFYRDIAKYTEQVRRYLDAFSTENVWVVLHDELMSNTEQTYRDTLRFLDVSPDFSPFFEVINANRTARSNGLQIVLRKSVYPSRWYGLLPSKVRDIFERGVMRLNTREAPRPPLSEDLRRRLTEEFTPEVKSLSGVLGKDLSHWTAI